MIKLMHGDCLELMEGIPDKSVDMVLCDLPYGTTACKWDVVIPFDKLWEQYRRVVKDNGAIVLFGSEPFSSHLRLSNLEWYKYDYVWVKTKASGFQNAKRQPMRKHENVMVFYQHQPVFNQQNLRELSKPINNGRARLRNDEQHRLGVAGKLDHKTTHTGWQASILEFANPSGAGHLHPTQKPVALLEYLIKTYSNEGDTILDNTMGSGSTGVACVNTNRSFIGIEKDDHYYEVACKRIEEAERMKMLEPKLF